MHKTKHVWEKITDIDNIKHAILKASQKKRKRAGVQRVLADINYYAQMIQTMLLEKTFVPSPYKEVIIKDGSSQKERVIHKPQFFPDQCVHWALVLPLAKEWGNSIQQNSCGSIPNRGLHYGKRKVERWLKNTRKKTKYCYKLDVKKYYQSVDQELLLAMFKRKIHDNNTLWLFDKIIHSHKQGLPIGNYTSQWFANLFLADVDWHIVQEFGVKHYVRYIDDMVLFSSNKKVLHKIRKQLEAILTKKNLKIKHTWQVFKVMTRGVDFLGYRMFHTHTIIRKSTAYRIHRRAKRIDNPPTLSQAQAVTSYLGITKHCDSYNFMQRFVLPYININQIKEIQRENSKSFATA
jgi:RNA-directed DNA polymerase